MAVKRPSDPKRLVAEGYEDDWLGVPMFWSGFERQTSERLIAGSGLHIEPSTVETSDEDGEPVSFLWVEARR